jgi:hypothetical protein
MRVKKVAVIRGTSAAFFLLTHILPVELTAGENLIFSNGFELGVTEQIAAARAVPDGATNLSIDRATVTYVKALLGSDLAGFFIQGSKPGPALFIAVDPAGLTPQPVAGDEVTFTITQMGTSQGLRQASQISNYVRHAALKPLAGLVQPASSVTDLVTAVDSYESELISLNGVITGSFGAAGTGFESAIIDTVGISGNSNFRLRLPAALRASEDLVTGCEFSLGPTPLWRSLAQAQASAWLAADVAATSCPAPTVGSAIAQSVNSVVIEFSRQLDPNSVQSDGSQFLFDNDLVATAASVSGRQVTLTTTAQVPAQDYLVMVQNTVTDTLGSSLQLPSSAVFQGYFQPAQVLINEINANIASGCDLVELRVTSGGSMTGFTLYQRTTALLTFQQLNVSTGDIVMVHFNGGSATCSAGGAPDETNSKVEFPNALFSNNYDTAWDWYSDDTNMTNTDNVLTLYDTQEGIQDAVFLSDDLTGTAAAATEAQAAIVAAAGGWEMVGGGLPPGGFIDDNFSAHAVVDLNATDTGKSGITIQRINLADTDINADWGMATFSWGLLNSGQTP